MDRARPLPARYTLTLCGVPLALALLTLAGLAALVSLQVRASGDPGRLRA